MDWSTILIGTLAGGVALFLWGMAAWMALPHHHDDFGALKNDEEVARALAQGGALPGMYLVPSYKSYAQGHKDPAFLERWKRGPNGYLVLFRPGPCMNPRAMLYGFLLDLAIAFGGTLVLSMTGDRLHALVDKWLFFAGLGFLVHATPLFAHSIWMGTPWRHTLTLTLDGIVAFSLLAIVLHHVT
ncbi:MAG: hypothetical protein ACREID_06965 [Planctomycetota bacterium]